MKTATIERYAVFGTSRHMQRIIYRGREILQSETPCEKADTVAYLRTVAARRGFTHVRFAGDWEGVTVPKTMKVLP